MASPVQKEGGGIKEGATSRLMELPAETRLKIFEMVMEGATFGVGVTRHSSAWNGGSYGQHGRSPEASNGLLLVSRQVRSESYPLFWKKTEICLSLSDIFREDLSKPLLAQLSLIQNLSTNLDHCYISKKQIHDLPRMLPALKNLVLKEATDAWQEMDDTGSATAYLPQFPDETIWSRVLHGDSPYNVSIEITVRIWQDIDSIPPVLDGSFEAIIKHDSYSVDYIKSEPSIEDLWDDLRTCSEHSLDQFARELQATLAHVK